MKKEQITQQDKQTELAERRSYKVRSVIVGIILFSLLIIAVTVLVGCESQIASRSLTWEADSFGIVRTLTVFDTATGDVLYVMRGNISVETDTVDQQLEVMVKNTDGSYKKNFVSLSPCIHYVIDDVKTGSEQYSITYNPDLWTP